MTRAAAWILVAALALAACGRLGPPVRAPRAEPPPPAEAAADEPDEAPDEQEHP